MITIALDEQGNFEEFITETKPVFIAGILYDDNGNTKDTDEYTGSGSCDAPEALSFHGV